MKSFSQHLSHAWQTVFRDKETFWTLFLLTNGPTIILILTFWALGYDVSSWFESQTMITEVLPYAIFIMATVIFWGFFWFIGMLYLARLFWVKKVTFESVFSDWKNIFPYIWTSICVALCYVAIWATVALIFAITFWIGYLGYIFTRWLSLEITIVIYVIGWIMAFLIAVSTILIALWIFGSLAFSTPAFFLDNQKYFQAPLTSRKIVIGKWWRVVWSILLASIILMIIPIILTVVQELIPTSHLAFTLVVNVIGWLAGVLLIAFIFSLYMDYKAVPEQEKIIPIKKTPQKKPKKHLLSFNI